MQPIGHTPYLFPYLRFYSIVESATNCVRLGESGTLTGSCSVTRHTLRPWPWCLTTCRALTCSATSPWTILLQRKRNFSPDAAEQAAVQRVKCSGVCLFLEPTAGSGWSPSWLDSGRHCAAENFLWSSPAEWETGNNINTDIACQAGISDKWMDRI